MSYPKRRVYGPVTAVLPNANQIKIADTLFQLADKAENRTFPRVGQLISLDAYNYGRGIEAYWSWDPVDANAPISDPAPTRRRSYPPTPVAYTPNVDFARRVALECACHVLQGSARVTAENVIDMAKALELYLNPPTAEQPEGQVAQTESSPESSPEIAQLLAQLQERLNAPATVADPVAPRRRGRKLE